METMRILLTGHQGYLGTVMAPVLASSGHDVVGLDTGLFAECVLGPKPQDPPGLQVDLRDIEPSHLQGFDAVIHLAALSNDPLGAFDASLTHEINHHASIRLARLAKEAGVGRFLYASTCSVYGVSGDELVTEAAPLKPLTPYAESKVRVEADLQQMVDASFCPVFLRNATAFGFSPRLRADIVLNNLVGHAVVAGQVRVLSDGTPWRPLVHVADIAQAFVAVLEAPRHAVCGRAFNVGTEKNNLTVAEIAKAVVAAVPDADLVITGESGNDQRSYRVDFSLFRRLVPTFKAQWSVDDGAEELATLYRRFGFDRKGFERRFTRLTRITEGIANGSIGVDLRPTSH